MFLRPFVLQLGTAMHVIDFEAPIGELEFQRSQDLASLGSVRGVNIGPGDFDIKICNLVEHVAYILSYALQRMRNRKYLSPHREAMRERWKAAHRKHVLRP